jgi:DNA gyrase subunit A
MIINQSGITIRMAVDAISVLGRRTQGVRLINLGDDDSIADVTVVARDQDQSADEPDPQEEE